MIPLADENENRIVPYVTYALILINVLVYIADILGVPAVQHWSMVPRSVMDNVRWEPAMTPSGQMLVNQFGQMLFQKLPGVGPHPQWITILTSMFMHGSLMHIGGNMLYLYIFGDNIEQTLGHIKFAFFYIVAGVLAALAHIYSNPMSMIPTVGASGAIAGVLGAYLILFPGNRVRTLIMLGFFWDFVEIPAIFVLGVWFIIQLTGTLGSGGLEGGGVAYWAHVGGFVAGVILILLMGGRRLARAQQSYRQQRDNRLSRWED